MENSPNNSNSSSNSRQIKNEKTELLAAFRSATSLDDILKVLRKMKESGFFEKHVEEYLNLAQKLTEELRQNDNILGFDSRRRRKIKGKGAKLKQAFYCAKSADEMLKAFLKMESHFNEKELGFDCWELAQKLYEERHDPENILCYGKRALKFAIDHTSSSASSLMIPSTLNLLGYACCKLYRYDESLSYLNWSERNLSYMELELVKSFPTEFVLRLLHGTHIELAIVKTAMGRGEEVVIHMRKILEIQEKTKAEGSIDQAIEKVVDGLKGLGLNEQDKVDGAVRLLNEMKDSAGDGDSSEKNSNMAFKMERNLVVTEVIKTSALEEYA